MTELTGKELDEALKKEYDLALDRELKQAYEQHKDSDQQEPFNFGQGIRDIAGAGLSAIGSGIHKASQIYDSIGAAPLRAAQGAIHDDKNPLKALIHQFGRSGDETYSERELAKKMGFSDIPTPIRKDSRYLGDEPYPGTGGLSEVDLVAGVSAWARDPFNIIPLGTAAKEGAKGIFKLAKGTVKHGSKAAAHTADALLDTKAISEARNIAGEAINETTTGLKKSLNVKISSDWERLKEIASTNGIDPEILPDAAKFFKGSPVGRYERAKAMGPAGAEELETLINGHREVSSAIDRSIQRLGDLDATPEKAGEAIRQGFQKAKADLFDSIDLTYKKVAKANPDLVINPSDQSKIVDIMREIKKEPLITIKQKIAGSDKIAQSRGIVNAANVFLGALKQKNIDPSKVSAGLNQVAEILDIREITNPQIAAIINSVSQESRALAKNIQSINAINAINAKQSKQLDDLYSKILNIKSMTTENSWGKSANDKFDNILKELGAASDGETGGFSNLVQALSDIGKEAFKNKGKKAADVNTYKLQEIYFQGRDIIMDIIKNQVGERDYLTLLNDNQRMSSFYNLSHNIAPIIDNIDKYPANKLFSELISNTNYIDELNKILPDKNLRVVRGAYLDTLFNRVKEQKFNPKGDISYGLSIKKIRKDRAISEHLLPIQEVDNIKDLLVLGDSFGGYINEMAQTGATALFKHPINTAFRTTAGKAVISHLKKKASSPQEVLSPINPLKRQRTPLELIIKGGQIYDQFIK